MLQKYRGDLLGGATAAIVALPLALAFGVASGAGAAAGMYGAIFAGFFAALFGGTPAQVTGPTGPMTVVMALVITHFSPNITAAFTVVMLAGCLQILFGKMGFGRFIKLMPQPVISGFMSGIGIIIILLQMGALTGNTLPDGSVLTQALAIPNMVAHINVEALLLGLVTLSVMFFSPKRLTHYVPPPLLAIVVGWLLAALFAPNAPVIGQIPSGLPVFHWPAISIADLPYILRFALVLAFLGAIDSLLTSLVADAVTRTSHDSNKELVGQGLGNIASGLMGGLPGAGATMRTLINVRSGGNSRLSGVAHSLILLSILLAFGDVAGSIPLAVLGGILVKVGIDIIDWRYLLRIHQLPKSGVVIMLTTLVMTVFVDLITAVAVGFVMASVLFVSRMADAQVKSAKFIYGADQMQDALPEEGQLLEALEGRVVLFSIEGPLSFGSARDVVKMIQNDVHKDVLILDFSHIPFIDSSASAALRDIIQRLNDAKASVIVFGVKEDVLAVLRKVDVIRILGEGHVTQTRLEALRLAHVLCTGALYETPPSI
jgi:SulP family sulfate permease